MQLIKNWKTKLECSRLGLGVQNTAYNELTPVMQGE